MEYDLKIGLGLQVIDVDLTGSDSAILADASHFNAIIFCDNDATVTASIEVSGPVTPGAPTTNEPAVFSDDVTAYGITSTHTYFRIPYEFKVRGAYLIQISITDNSNIKTTAKEAISVGVGDGLPFGVAY